MNKTLRWLTFAFVSLVMMTQYTNCGTYSDNSTFSVTGSSVECVDDDCITPTVDNLSLKVNLGGGTEYSVPANLSEFNLGGDCNEGGFPFNTIRWELYLNNVKVRDSGMLGIAGGNKTAHSQCINGRFLLYVNLNPIAEDNVNRTGLSNGTSGRSPYDLWIEIYGQETQNGPAKRNTLKGRVRVSLIAI